MKGEVARLKRMKADKVSLEEFKRLLDEAQKIDGTIIQAVVTYKASSFSVVLEGVALDSITVSDDMISINALDRPYSLQIPCEGLIYCEDSTPDTFGADYGSDVNFTFGLDDLAVTLMLHYPPED